MTTTNKPRIEPRKPGSVQAAAGFITGGQAPAAQVETPDPATGTVVAPEPSPLAMERPAASDATASRSMRGKAVMSRRRSGKEVRQLTVYLEPDLERQLKLVAVEEDRLPSDVIADALRMYFGAR